MKRLALIGVCLLCVLAVTGAVAARLWSDQFDASLQDRYGHTWSASGDYAGEIRILGAQKELLGTLGSTGNGTGEATVRAFGQSATFSGSGEHAWHDDQGRIIGYVVMSPRAAPTFNFSLLGSASGATTDASGIHGFDKTAGLEWSVKGRASARLLRASDHSAISEGSNSAAVSREGTASSKNAPAPEIHVKFQGKSITRKGYGSHEIKDSAGHAVYILEVSP
jgi:hypothetical protein